MAYIKNEWSNQNVERPKTYRTIKNEDNSTTLIESFGNVVDLGTPVNADNMNHIEDGIKEAELQGISAYDPTGNYQTGYFTQYGGILYKSLTDNNLGNQPDESTENWEEYRPNMSGKANIDADNITSLGFSNLSQGIFPDYENGISFSVGTNYICPANGYIYVLLGTVANYSDGALFLNDEVLYRCGGSGAYGVLLVPVVENDKVKFTVTKGEIVGLKFLPLKGVN